MGFGIKFLFLITNELVEILHRLHPDSTAMNVNEIKLPSKSKIKVKDSQTGIYFFY